MSDGFLELAESLNAHMPLSPGEERIETAKWVVFLGTGGTHPAYTVVQRFRLAADEVEEAVAEIRALLIERGRPASTWEIGPSATPPDLETRLLKLGLTPFEEPVATGMVLRRPLPDIGASGRSAVVARRAETVADYVAAFEVLYAVFHERHESPGEREARAAVRLQEDRSGRGAMFLGVLDGEIVAAASAIHTSHAVILSGSATLEGARGRGAYRVLVAARYEDAVGRGTPTLVIQAGAMSRPILERLGFEAVAEVRILLDGRVR